MNIWEVEMEVEKYEHKLALEVENASVYKEIENNVRASLIRALKDTESWQKLMPILNGLMFHDVKLDTKAAKGLKDNVNLSKFGSLKKKNEDKKTPALIGFVPKESFYPQTFTSTMKQFVLGRLVKKFGWLDNAGGRTKAGDVMGKYREEFKILKAPHPPNSPYLNMIEEL